MSYLSKPLGNISAMEFSISGINQIALIEKAKVTVAMDGLDVTGLTLASGSTFQNVVFVADSATLEQSQVKTATSHYIEQKLSFNVITDSNEDSQSILLAPAYLALVRKNNGKYVLVGDTSGLTSLGEYTNNSTTDDASRKYVLTARNMGDARNVLMDETALQALINKI